jgi:two-component system response regulator AtoC
MAHVLIVDDEPNMRWVLQEALNKAGYHTHTAAGGEEALALCADRLFDVVILDLKLKGMDGLATLRQIHARWPQIVVLILTAFGTVATAVEALQNGAADYLRKPFDVEDILFKISRALERQQLHAEIARLKGPEPPTTPGSAPAWRNALSATGEALARGLDVRLIGEPGSGRASIAQAAHRASPRHLAPFVSCDLTTLTSAHQESLLAGGAGEEGFWGAAGQGTLLLRHIGRIAPSGAAGLVRLLERRAASGVGPLLVLTGTEEEWESAPRLSHRVVDVAVPPLREHLDDVLPFAANWLPQRRITPAAIELLHAYEWPGNLGELRGVLERAALLAGDGPIDGVHLPERIRAAPLPHTPLRLPPEGLSLEALEIDLLRQALARAGGNKSRAAELLGLTRHTLLYRLEKYKIGET